MKRIYDFAVICAVLIAGVAPALFFGNKTALEFPLAWQSITAGITAGLTYILTGALSGHAAVEFWQRRMWFPMVLACAFMILVVSTGYYNLEGIARNLVLLEPVAYMLGGLFHVLEQSDKQPEQSEELVNALAEIAVLTERAENAERSESDLADARVQIATLTKRAKNAERSESDLADARVQIATLTKRAENAERSESDLADAHVQIVTLTERVENAERSTYKDANTPLQVAQLTESSTSERSIIHVQTERPALPASTVPLDETHFAILELLQSGVHSPTKIGKQLGFSHTTARRRIQKLVDAGHWVVKK